MNSIYTRRSIRKYKNQPLSDDQVNMVVKAGMNAPSAGNEQAWCFIAITDRKLLDKIPDIHPYAKMIYKAPAAILVCGNLELEKHSGYWVQDCAACTQNMLLEATELGLGSVWLGVHPRKERVSGLQQMFQLPEHIVPFSLVVIGHADEKKEPNDTFDTSKLFYNQYR